MVDWTLDLFFKRDITLFQSRPTQLLKEMHLESGDVIFHAGDPALSLYIVQAGKIELRDENGAVLRTVDRRTSDRPADAAAAGEGVALRRGRGRADDADPGQCESLRDRLARRRARG